MMSSSLIAASSTSSSQSDDDAGWTRLGEVSTVLPLYKRKKAVAAVEKLFYASPLAHRFVEQLTDFVVGEQGFELTSSNDVAAAILNSFWHSPVNNLPSGLYAAVQEYFVYGEMAYLTKVHSDGFVALTYIPPTEISDVTEKTGEPGEPDKITLATGASYDVISWSSIQQKLVGDCFFFRAQHLGAGVRGFPCMLPLVDFLRAWEAFTYGYLKKRSLYDAIWWDVELQGFNQDQIDAWLATKQAKPPQPGSIFAHNERVAWKLTQADFKGGVLSNDAQFFLDLLLGSAGLSSFSRPSSSRVRDRGEVLDPVARGLSARQYEIRSYFAFIGSFVLQEARVAGALESSDHKVLCQAPRLGVRDFQRSSGSLLRFVNALGQAVDNTWLNPREASTIFRDMLVRLGLLDRSLPPKAEEPGIEEPGTKELGTEKTGKSRKLGEA